MAVARLARGVRSGALSLLPALLLVGCGEPPAQALGSLEYDRITLPAPAAERIVAINVREGQRVTLGQTLLQLEVTRTQSATRAAQAEAQRQREVLSELESGPRSEAIAQARAHLAAAEASARDARAFYARLQPLGQRQLVAASDVDRARAAASSSEAQVHAARAALEELVHGTRQERIAQGEAAVHVAEAQAAGQEVTLEKLRVVAPRAGIIDSLPFKLGDQAPIGAPLAIILAGDAPHARVYVPEPIRVDVEVGDSARVFVLGREVDGRQVALPGKVRMIRSEPGFTPYFALVGKDAARLSYLAEIELTGTDARALPAGLPVRVEFE